MWWRSTSTWGLLMRRILLGFVFGLAASCAYAQTAPSPADVGISKGDPDVFKLKGSDNAWTPFGSIDPSTHIFIPGTNGAIAPNDCIKWGPGLTSAGAACNSVTGGAHPGQSADDLHLALGPGDERHDADRGVDGHAAGLLCSR